MKIAASAIALFVTACTECSGSGVYVSEELESASAFIERIELLPRGGLVADPRATEDKRVRVSFLLPVQRSSISLSQFSASTLVRTVTLTRVTYDDGSTSTAGTCRSIELDLADDLYDPSITIPIPVTISWDASRIRFAPDPGQTPPTAPTEPLQFAFDLSVSGPTGNPPRIVRFGFPAEPNPAQPGWGRPVELSDLEAIGGTDALDRVGRSFVLGDTATSRVRPHASLEMQFDRPMVAALTSLSPLDIEGFDPVSDSALPLLSPLTKVRSRTPRGLLPDTVYRLTVISRDTGAFLPLHSASQDASGHFLMPRYSDAVVSAAMANGLTREQLYADVDYTFRTGPMRVEAPLHAEELGAPRLPSGMIAVRVEIVDPPSPVPDRVEVAIRNTNGTLRASGSMPYPSGWSTGTLTQAGQTRAVRRRTLSLSLPTNLEETDTITITARAGTTFVADDAIDVRLDMVAPRLNVSQVTITNEDGADDNLDRVCVSGLSRDVMSVGIAIEGGMTHRFDADAFHCERQSDDTRTCCESSVGVGLPPGQDETTTRAQITVTDTAGNVSAPVTVTSTPSCPQPPMHLVRAGSMGRAAMSESPSTGLPEIVYLTGRDVRMARWTGDRWDDFRIYRVENDYGGEIRMGVTLGMAHAPDGAPFVCVQHGIRYGSEGEDRMVGTQLLLRGAGPRPTSANEFTVREIGASARLTGCSVVSVPSGTDRGAIVAFSERGDGTGADRSSLVIAYVRDSGAISIERPTGLERVRQTSIARDASGRVHLAFVYGSGPDGSGVLSYMMRETNGTWGAPVMVHDGYSVFGVWPIVRLDTSGVPWVAVETFDRSMVGVYRRNTSVSTGWRTYFLESVGASSGRNRAGLAGADDVLLGRAFDLASDRAGGVWLAYAELTGTQRVIARHFRAGAPSTMEVVDHAGGPATVAIAVGSGGRRWVLSDERRAPSGRRASLHLFDDATGLVVQRDPDEMPYPTCASYHQTRRVQASALRLEYPDAPSEPLIDFDAQQADDVYGLIGSVIGERQNRVQISGVEIETFGTQQSALPDLVRDVALRIGRGALRYQSHVCVPEHLSSDLRVDACEVHHEDASEPGPTRFAFPVQVERAPIRGVAIVPGAISATVLQTWAEMPEEEACRGEREFLSYEDGQYRCIQCAEPPPEGRGTLFYYAAFNACLVCPSGALTPVPRPILDSTTFACRSCADANAAVEPFESGESRFAPSPDQAQCVRCSPGTIPRPCSDDSDCGPDGAAYVCGALPGIASDGERACVARRACIDDSSCPSGSSCVLDDAECEGDDCPRACRTDDGLAVAGPSTRGGSADTIDFLCSPIGCHRCWDHDYCRSDDECPANHRCMNRADGSFDLAHPQPSRSMPYPTPMCMLRAAYVGPNLDTLMSISPAAARAVTTFDVATSSYSLPRTISAPGGQVEEVLVRITDARAEIIGLPDAPRVRVSVDFQSPARVIGYVSKAGVGFEFEAEIHGDPPRVIVELTPYLFEGRLRFAVVSSRLDADIDVGEPDCDGIGCAIDNAMSDFIIGGIVELLAAVDIVSDPDRAADSALGRLQAVGTGVGPLYEQMFEDSLLRAIFVRPFGQPITLQHFGDPDDIPLRRRFAWIPERVVMSSDGLSISVRDGR
jgi:hypothetical protein